MIRSTSFEAPRPSFVYVVPVHNEERSLPANVERIVARFASSPPVRVVLAENGSQDSSAEVARRLSAAYPPGRVIAVSTPRAGLGYGLALGLQAAFEAAPVPDPNTFYVLTAADLPFAFSDLEEVERVLLSRHDLQIAVGSKAHPSSRTSGRLGRGLASLGYRVARRVLLRMKTTDSQGSIFVRDPLARKLLALVQSRDFFFSTEFVYHAERQGMQVVEVPVELEREVRASTVKLLRDAPRMLRQMLELRARPGAP